MLRSQENSAWLALFLLRPGIFAVGAAGFARRLGRRWARMRCVVCAVKGRAGQGPRRRCVGQCVPCAVKGRAGTYTAQAAG
jgi:hypothetical protein